jgi:hypothetical protein
MRLQESEIIKIAASDVDEWIIQAQEDNILLKAHYYGDGKDDLLETMDGLETSAQRNLRRKYAMSNTFVVDTLFRPFYNVFSSKGGSIELDTSTESIKTVFKSKIKNINSGFGVKEYLKQIWTEAFITDPNGLVFLEVSRDGLKSSVEQKSIQGIKNMKRNGVTPEYVMFEADQKINNDKTREGGKDESFKLHWFVDDAKYYRIKVYQDKDRSPEIIENESIVNSFGRVPAFVNSPILDTNRKIQISPIWKQIELLNKYLRDGSVKDIYIAKHGFPIFWMYSNLMDICNSCGGGGTILDLDDNQRRVHCGSCGGAGRTLKKDVSDALLLSPPKSKDDPVLSAVAGYVQPDIETWREQRTEQEWTMGLLTFSLWGAMKEKGQNETATGRWIDVQPVTNRLNDFADIVEGVWENIITLLAQFHIKNSFKGVSVSIGRRFILETPDQIWNKYVKAKADGASETLLTQLLNQYYESEYQTNDMLRAYYTKLSLLDPLPHNTISEAISLNVPQDFKDQKVYFSEFVETTSMVEIIESDLLKLKESLNTFVAKRKSLFTSPITD